MNALAKLWRNVWIRRLIYLIVLLAAAWLIKLVFFPSKAQNNYITAPVTRGDLEQTVLATGIVKPYKQVAVGAQVTGEIKSLKVKLGQTVKQGELLAVIDPRVKLSSK